MTARHAFDTVVVANRGEIALRIFRTARRLGYRTVALYSDADREAPHVRAADHAVHLGASPPRDSYLAIDTIVRAAQAEGRVAVHPGYGFLSENADFARAVTDAGLVFLGPDASSIDAMGNKSAAKARIIEAGVPCVPGYLGADQSDATLVAEGRRIGFPLMVKAAAGGGGRGMRRVETEAALAHHLQAARSEAESAFGNGQLLLERAVTGARHVEIQVFGDRAGTIVHFGERDCSIQRRNQKVVEESPSPAVSAELRRAMGDAAIKAARAVRYVGAGTVEFLLGGDGHFYFLEMNTRLQVEHAVTEKVYDVDLVEWQLRVAAGEALPWTQDEIAARRSGHAIEVRLCAEDADYRPQTGKILRWIAPTGDSVRVDAALEDGAVVSPFYDSMIGKIIAHGSDRESARRRLVHALDATSVLGLTTNRDLLRAIVQSDKFASGMFGTSFLSEETFPTDDGANLRHSALAGLTLWLSDAHRLATEQGFGSELTSFESTELAATPIALEGASRIEVTVQKTHGTNDHFAITAGTSTFAFAASLASDDSVRYREGDRSATLRFARDGDDLWIDAEGRIGMYRDRTYAPSVHEDASDGTVRASGAGKIVRVHAKPGDEVRRGQSLVVVESMKMEFDLTSPIDGVVHEVFARVGEQVAARRVLVVVSGNAK